MSIFQGKFVPQMRPKNVSTKRVARRTFLTQATAPEGRNRNEVSTESIWAFLEKWVCSYDFYKDETSIKCALLL